MLGLYHQTAAEISKITTQNYSTSFTLGIKAFPTHIRKEIYAIYAFSRFTDEIVDTFLDLSIDQRRTLLHTYKNNTFQAIEMGISPFPVLHSFQQTVNQYQIDFELINAFFNSMEMDLDNGEHSTSTYDEYIYGSAEVIGLMCLKVFVNGDADAFEELKYYAQKLGAAFQKVNFLRDIKSDFEDRGRIYFPNVDFTHFNPASKKEIEADIEADFKIAYEGILKLPVDVKKGVYLAYKYYYALFNKIRKTSPANLQNERLRISNSIKAVILLKSLARSYVGAY
jgi:phytoene synthase